MGGIFGVDLKHDPFDEVSRVEWGARPPLARLPQILPASVVVVHFTHSKTCSSKEECCKLVRELQREHMDDKHHNDIKYNFLIGADGAVYEGRGWGVEGIEVPLFETTLNDYQKEIKCVDIAFIGTLEDVETKMPQMLKTFKDFIKASKLKRVLKMENLYVITEGGDRQLLEERKMKREFRKAKKKMELEKKLKK